MKYDITKQTAPKMPRLGKGTECVKILLSQVSKDMHAPLIPMLFPILGAHVSGCEFQYPDLTWKELCGQMANLVAESGGNKGQLSLLVEAICRDFRLHDEAVLLIILNYLIIFLHVSNNLAIFVMSNLIDFSCIGTFLTSRRLTMRAFA